MHYMLRMRQSHGRMVGYMLLGESSNITLGYRVTVFIIFKQV